MGTVAFSIISSLFFIAFFWLMIAYRVGRPGDRTMFYPLFGANPNTAVVNATTLASFITLVSMLANMRTADHFTLLIPIAAFIIGAFIWIYYDFRYNLLGRREDNPDLKEPFQSPRKRY